MTTKWLEFDMDRLTAADKRQIGGVFITFLVYIVPMLLFRSAKDFHRFANKPETIIVFGLGVIIMGVSFWQMFAG